MKRKRYFLSIVALFYFFLGFANVSVTASIDSSSILIGEQTMVHLVVRQTNDQVVHMPVFSDEMMPGVQIVKTLGDTLVKENNIQITWNFIITSFTPGEYSIPPFEVHVGEQSIASKALSLTVKDVDKQFEEGKIPGTIKNIYYPPFPTYIWYLLVAISVLLIMCGILGYLYWRKHQNDPEPFERSNAVAISAQPEVTALEMIRQLRDGQMWKNPGQQKKFFTSLTDILRQYFYRRYNIQAMEMTSSELLDALYKKNVPIILRNQVKEISFTADMTKFAKHLPDDNECNRCLDFAENIIQQTMEKETPKETTPAEQREQALLDKKEN